MYIKSINTEPDGVCRTIKAQYGQSSLANFIRGGTFGATGVIVIEDNTDRELVPIKKEELKQWEVV